ncbi:MAG: hypothetical protein OXE78_09395 [Gammaproteobacteria bacterium]|nr:hypothetical protein [Gammaproteobacteria bacterium]
MPVSLFGQLPIGLDHIHMIWVFDPLLKSKFFERIIMVVQLKEVEEHVAGGAFDNAVFEDELE